MGIASCRFFFSTMEEFYDVIVIGGGPIGLAAAYYSAKKNKKVLVLEQFNFGNDHGSSAGFSRQFRICYSERHLSDLAVKASKKWDELMDELKDYTLMERTGTLWFGDPNPGSSGSSGEGNIDQAIVNLKSLNQEYTEITTKEELHEKFPFVSAAVESIENPKALFVPDGGTVNVPGLVRRLHHAISKHSGCKLMKSIRVTSIDYSSPDKICVHTNDQEVFYGLRVILTPGTYVNHLLSALKPAYDKLINLDIFLWASTYFKLAESGHPHPTTWPTWYFFGNRKNSKEPIDENLYYGFPIEHPTPTYARVAPAFISGKTFYFHLYPGHVNDRPLDRQALDFTSSFVQSFMPGLDPTSIDDMETTCVAGFARKVNDEKDRSGGIVLDFVPCTSNRIVLATGGWCMKYVPVMGIILSEMALEGAPSSEYAADVRFMNIHRGILVDKKDACSKALPEEQRGKMCRELWH